MKWYEFSQDNGDGSMSKRRFKTKDEAEKTLDWLENNAPNWTGDSEGVDEVDTESERFWDTFEEVKEENE